MNYEMNKRIADREHERWLNPRDCHYEQRIPEPEYRVGQRVKLETPTIWIDEDSEEYDEVEKYGVKIIDRVLSKDETEWFYTVETSEAYWMVSENEIGRFD